MPTPFRLRFVRVQLAWLLGLLLALVLAGAFSYPLFVLLAVIGFVTIAELLTPVDVTPRWDGDLDVFVTLALVAAVIAAGVRVLQLFAPGVLP
ncbi:hypothetical protein [Haloterrigena alkaliphila]|uniref:Uncharacterized protein n=1 Tax=Haloterrigena alkaliphila TaxID=2816475 RepID=A0A8A2VBL4_9EURY|nr:hypothetical protein [Haloterrigena alkaliphila]QSW99413.1 hypothetical protein J0X25_00200 [Haloterrigena alkaliphila]